MTIRWLVRGGLATLVALPISIAPASGGPRQCSPRAGMAYEPESVVYQFSYPACGRTHEMGRVRVAVSIRRCAESCSTRAKKVVCRPDARCVATLRVEHPIVEAAEYTARSVYRSSGHRTIAGAESSSRRCVAAVATTSCA